MNRTTALRLAPAQHAQIVDLGQPPPQVATSPHRHGVWPFFDRWDWTWCDVLSRTGIKVELLDRDGGRSPLSLELAEKLGLAFKNGAQFWLDVADQARREAS